jgi:hypothetical protein
MQHLPSHAKAMPTRASVAHEEGATAAAMAEQPWHAQPTESREHTARLCLRGRIACKAVMRRNVRFMLCFRRAM